MDSTSFERYKEQLQKQRAELQKLLSRFASKDPHVRDEFHSLFPSYGSDEEDNAAEVSDYEDEVGIERNLETMLKEVDGALERIAQGTYGACRVCGKEIEAERLSVMPSTSLCIEHKATRA